MNRERRLQRARTLLLMDHPFFGSLAVRLPLIEDESVVTAITNGLVIRYHPEFIDSLTDDELKGVLAHEVMHVANGHCWRRTGRDKERWNEACDYAINKLLIESGLTLPKTVLVDDALDGSAESIYNELGKKPEQDDDDEPDSDEDEDDKPDDGEEDGNNEASNSEGDDGEGEGDGDPTPDPSQCGAVEDCPEEKEGDNEANEAEWKVAVAQAVMAAESTGTLPAGLKRFTEELLNPKVPWTVLLRDFVERTARNDYDWRRPNVRYLSSGFVMPGLMSEQLPEIVLAVDTSMSIDQATLDCFAAEASAILGHYETTIHLVYCDAAVQGYEVVTRADLPLKLKALGGGGTKFQPVFDWVEREGLTPACLIYLTDMEGPMPTVEPDYPTLWVTIREPSKPVPFGDVTFLERDA